MKGIILRAVAKNVKELSKLLKEASEDVLVYKNSTSPSVGTCAGDEEGTYDYDIIEVEEGTDVFDVGRGKVL